MILTISFCILLFLLSLCFTVLLRTIKKILQFDDLFSHVTEVMIRYGTDLNSSMTGDPSPEMLDFHRKNLAALKSIEEAVRLLWQVTPPSQKKNLPRPDVG